MKHFLFIVLSLLIVIPRSPGQDKQAIHEDVDTMRNHLPQKKLAEMVTIHQILITGNIVTRRKVILREMSVQEGMLVDVDSLPELLNQNKLRLVNLALFDNIKIDVDRINKKEVDIHVDLKERWYWLPYPSLTLADRNFNTWWVKENHDIQRAILGLTIADKNFRGNLETLAISAQVGYSQKLGLSYSIPYLDKAQKHGLGFTVSWLRSEQTYYKTDSDKLVYVGDYYGPAILQQIQAGITYTFRPAYATRHIFQVSYMNDWVGDTILKLNPNYFLKGNNDAKFLQLFYRLEYNDVDNWNYPVLGYKLVLQAYMNIGFQGIKYQNYATIEAGMFKNPLPEWFFSAIFRGRLMYPQKQPYYFQGGLGTSTDYVRGYEYYVIDGSQYGVVRFDLKREIFNKTWILPNTRFFRYFSAFPLRIYPKIFVDAGYINNVGYAEGFNPTNDFLSNRLLYSAGVGLDIVTLYDIKVRLEWAWNHLGRNGLYLHFNSE